jgi:hypothetical protein
MELRQNALKTLIESKKSQQAEQQALHSQNYPIHDQRPFQQQQPIVPQILNSPRYGRADNFRPHYNAFLPQRQHFLPIHPPMGHIPPHVNPHYQPPTFNPAPIPSNDVHMMNPIDIPKYEPTPPSRLSPRSAR